MPQSPWSARSAARRLALGACAASLLVSGLPALSTAASAAPTTLYLSEYVEGSSNNKAVEIANPTGAAVDLAGWDLQVFFNGTATPGLTVPLSGTVAAGDVFVLASANASSAVLAAADQTTTSNLWNGDDAIVLRQSEQVRDSLGQPGVDPGTEWGTGLTSTADNTLRRRDGAGPDVTPGDAFDPSVEWAGFATDTFDGLGVAGEGAAPPPPPPPGPAEPTRISAVQGSGAASPLVGSTVTVEGVVTSLISQNDALTGFFVQEQDAQADGDTATSEGLYVVCGSACPAGLAEGDVVRATGAVGESFGTTQLTASEVVRDGTAAQPTAAVVELPASGSTREAATFERLEGMRTTIPTTLAVSEYFNLARFGELVLTAGSRPYQYTQRNAPSATGNAAYQAALATQRIVLDDASNDQNDAVTGQADEPVYFPQPGGLSTGNRFRGGDTISGLTGVMEYSFGAWKLRPTAGATYAFQPANPRPATPPAVEGTLKVASFNVLNYFAQVDETSSNDSGDCGPTATADCRGADSEAERVRQRDKVVAALKALDADVYGLIEIQNDSGAATAQLVSALNAATAPGTYDYVRTGVIGTDAIKQALVYKRSTVELVGAFDTLTTADDARFLDTRNRPTLIQTFRQRSTGEVLTVAVNHFKSKGSSCGSGDDAVADGSGNCDRTRTAAAAALADHLVTDPTGSGDGDFLVIGDLNSYAEERPITTLEANGYTNLLERFEGPQSYGYVFDGQLGDLDHALASAQLLGQVTDAAGWKINADEPVLFDYNDTVLDAGEAAFERESAAQELYAPDPYRSSDHDPVVVGLTLAEPAARDTTVQVLGISDFHGHLDPPPAATPDAPSVAGRLAGVVNRYEREFPNTVFVSSGDNIGASPFLSAVARDEPAIDVLNAMGLDVSAVGNHELDRGYADLSGRVVPRSRFPFLAANMEGESPDLAGSTVTTLPNGVRVGLIGVVTQQTASLVAPSGIAGITFTDPVAAANREAARLTDGDAANGEADVIVLLAHEGAERAASTVVDCEGLRTRDDAFGRIVRDTSNQVDVVLGGHTHVRVDCEFPLEGRGGSPRVVLQPGEYGTALDRLTFRYDRATDVLSDVQGSVVTFTPSGATGFPNGNPAVTDAEVERIVDAAQARANELGRPVIGRITADLRRATTPTGAEDRGRESVLGNFVADAQLAAVEARGTDADIAFMNPGGLRADFLVDGQRYGDEGPGEVTFGEAGAVQPFANTLFTLRLTGAQVKQVLEEQTQPAGSSRPVLALGVNDDLFFAYDTTQPAGSRVSGITLRGVPIDPAATYTVVTNSFLAGGGDNFRTLAAGTERTDTGLDDLRALTDYFAARSPITPDTAPRRSGSTALPGTPDGPSASPTPTGSPTPDAGGGGGGGGGGGTPVTPGSSASPSASPAPSGSPSRSASPSPSGSPVPAPSGTPGPTPGPSGDPEPERIERTAGEDRFETGIELSREAFGDDGAQAVVLARSDDFADALAGTPLAAQVDGPLLMTPTASLDERVLAEVERVLADGGTVHVLGGPAAVSEEAAAQLEEAGFVVERHAGADRYGTAVAVAEELGRPETVLLATGLSFPDGLAAGVAAAQVGGAVLLTAGDVAPAATLAYLAGNGDGDEYAVGGPAARAVPSAQPVVGATRFETAVLLAERFFEDPSSAGVVSGLVFADALSAGWSLARAGSPLLLTLADELPDSTGGYLQDTAGSLDEVRLVGGPDVVGPQVEDEVRQSTG